MSDIKQRFLENARNLKAEATEHIKTLFREAKNNHSEIYSIIFEGQPNSYNDEGMSCEGRIVIKTEEFDKLNTRTYSGRSYTHYEDDSEGVWSADDDNCNWDEKTHPLSTVAKELFDKVSELNEVVGYDGYFSIEV